MKELELSILQKVIGILCVILGHLGSSNCVSAVFPFHMPLFFVIFRWFLSEKLDPKTFFIKRCRSLLPAYFATSICLCIQKSVIRFFRRDPCSDMLVDLRFSLIKL